MNKADLIDKYEGYRTTSIKHEGKEGLDMIEEILTDLKEMEEITGRESYQLGHKDGCVCPDCGAKKNCKYCNPSR